MQHHWQGRYVPGLERNLKSARGEIRRNTIKYTQQNPDILEIADHYIDRFTALLVLDDSGPSYGPGDFRDGAQREVCLYQQTLVFNMRLVTNSSDEFHDPLVLGKAHHQSVPQPGSK